MAEVLQGDEKGGVPHNPNHRTAMQNYKPKTDVSSFKPHSVLLEPEIDSDQCPATGPDSSLVFRGFILVVVYSCVLHFALAS